jgi:cytochrome c
MKFIVASMAVAAGLMIAGSVMAVEMPELAKKHDCNACHTIDKRVVGPAWMDVSKRYKGDKDAEAKLIIKVSKGGSGNWGGMPMPANDPAGKIQPDIKALVQFVLGLAK